MAAAGQLNLRRSRRTDACKARCDGPDPPIPQLSDTLTGKAQHGAGLCFGYLQLGDFFPASPMTRTSRLRCDKSPPANSRAAGGGAHHAPIARESNEVVDEH